MRPKKNPSVNLDRYSFIFFQVGLAVTLLISYLLIETKSYKIETIAPIDEIETTYYFDENIPITEVKHVPPPPPKEILPPPSKMQDVFEVVDNDTEIVESVFESTETRQDEGIATNEQFVKVSDIDYVEEEEVEEVPFIAIQRVPIFPGCENEKNNESMGECFSAKVGAFVNEEFDTSLGRKLGLKGIQKIYVKFKVDENGYVVDILARGPSIELEKEAERVIKSLPKMIPGIQRDKNVGCIYALPIIFEVRELQ